MKAKKIKKLARQTWKGGPEDEVTYVYKGKTRRLGNCFRGYYQQLKRSQR